LELTSLEGVILESRNASYDTSVISETGSIYHDLSPELKIHVSRLPPAIQNKSNGVAFKKSDEVFPLC